MGNAASAPPAPATTAGLDSLILAAEIDAAARESGGEADGRPALPKRSSASVVDLSSEKAEPETKKRRTMKAEFKEMKAERSEDDFEYTIDEALRDKRIGSMKATRLHECMQSGDWSEIAYSLLCEQIPLKRRGKGCYNCQVCLIPKKGHACELRQTSPRCLVEPT